MLQCSNGMEPWPMGNTGLGSPRNPRYKASL